MIVTRILVVAALVVAGAGAAWAEEGPFPVRLNPALGLASADPAAIEARLKQPIPANESMLPPTDYVKFSEGWRSSELPLEQLIVDKVRPVNCAQINALLGAGYVPWGVPVYLDDCKALGLLTKASPSKTSFVRDFSMTRAAVDKLPVMLDTSTGVDRMCDELIANRRGVPWGRFDTIVDVDIYDKFVGIVSTEHSGERWREGEFEWLGGARTRVEILAWADFDLDGIEDLLVVASSKVITWRLPEGTHSFATATQSDVFVLSRTTPNATMNIVDAERYLLAAGIDPMTCTSQ